LDGRFYAGFILSRVRRVKLNWFCKHCQTTGEFSLDAPISTEALCRLIVEAHEKTRTLGGEPWVLLSLENSGTVGIAGDPPIATLTTPVRVEYPALSFVVLHVQ